MALVSMIQVLRVKTVTNWFVACGGFTVDAQTGIPVYTPPPAGTWHTRRGTVDGLAPASVEDLIAVRLDQSGPAGQAADLVLAALFGDDDLDAALSGTRRAAGRLPWARSTAESLLAGLHLRSIDVEGFRGIGPKAARLQPGPGLTVVAGRNGSGKSSLAEAAELVHTDDNKRW